MIILFGNNSINKAVKKAIDEATADVQTISDLKKEIATLTIERDKRTEEFARKERDIEHKVGLERKRQEFEVEQARREASVKIREENLAADKERFKNEMDFQRKHLEGEITSLRELVGEMLKRLPSAEIVAKIGKR